MSNFELLKTWKILFVLLLPSRPGTFSDAISNLDILKKVNHLD